MYSYYDQFHYVEIKRWKEFLILLAIFCVALLPFLGLTDFNTKGEPREAVVAFSMLQQDNWILPSNNGGDIPYKPPFFHWMVALAALVFNGGEVNEYVSRLPSAIACIAMCMGVYWFYARRAFDEMGALTALVTFTAFEMYRAAMNCRVDMMLTALSVGALLLLFRWWKRGMKWLPWWAILLMSAATLTKGPVGIIVPCLAGAIYIWVMRVPFLKILWKFILIALLSLVLPMCWYVAAYQQGGDEFLRLVMEENFGRMTGTMTYESHVNPWYYNVLTLLAGYLPWTIAALLCLFFVRWREVKKNLRKEDWRFRPLMRRFREKIDDADPIMVFSAVCAITVFVFYCIPSSKRSVYLMPMYPFLGYLISEMLVWLSFRKWDALALFGDFIAFLGLVLFMTICLVRWDILSADMFDFGSNGAQTSEMVLGLYLAPWWCTWPLAGLPVAGAILWWKWLRDKMGGITLPLAEACLVVLIYIVYAGVIQPPVLNAKSLREQAEGMKKIFSIQSDNIYEFISGAEEAAGNPLHFFEVDYYMGDPVRNFRREHPEEGYLLITPEDAAAWLPTFEKENYSFVMIYPPRRTRRDAPALFHFNTVDPNAEPLPIWWDWDCIPDTMIPR